MGLRGRSNPVQGLLARQPHALEQAEAGRGQSFVKGLTEKLRLIGVDRASVDQHVHLRDLGGGYQSLLLCIRQPHKCRVVHQ